MQHALIELRDSAENESFWAFRRVHGDDKSVSDLAHAMLRGIVRLKFVSAGELFLRLGNVESGTLPQFLSHAPKPNFAHVPKSDQRIARHVQITCLYGTPPRIALFPYYGARKATYEGPLLGFALEHRTVAPESLLRAAAKRVAFNERQRQRRADRKRDEDEMRKLRSIEAERIAKLPAAKREALAAKRKRDQAFLDALGDAPLPKATKRGPKPPL